MDPVFNRMSEASWLVDWPSGRLLCFNPAAERLYGRALPQSNQPPELWLQMIAPKHQNFVRERIDRYLCAQAANAEQADLTLEYTLTRPDGQQRWVRSQIWQFPSPTGTQLQGLTVDLTAQRELYQQKLQFEKLTSNIPGVIYQYLLRPDGSHYFPYMSPRCYDLYELDPAVLVADPDLVWSLIHPDDVEEFNQSVAESAQNLTTWNYQWRNYTHSGQLKWLSATAQPERRPNGDIVWDGMIVDISQQKQAELERDRFFNCALDLFAIIGFDGYFKAINPAWVSTLGYSLEELKTQPFLSFVHPDDREQTQLEAQKIATGHHTPWFENRYRTRNGDYRWLAWRTVSLPDEGVMYTSARDITDQKQNAAERERLITILEASPDFISSSDLQGNITYVNRGGRDIVGVSPDCDLNDYKIEDFIPADMVDFLAAEAIPSAIKDGLWKGTTQLKRANGEPFPVSQIIIYHPPTPEYEGYLSTIARDVTETQAIQERLRQQEEFLRSIYDNQGNIVFVVDYAEDGQWRYSDWNARAEEVTGIYRPNMVGKTPVELFGDAIGSRTTQHYDNCLKAGDKITVEESFSKDDLTLYLHLTLTPIFDSHGRVTRLIGTSTDITERRLVEFALESSKRKYRLLAQKEKLINSISQQIRKSLDLNTILETTVQAIYELLDIDRCYFLLYAGDKPLSQYSFATEAKRDGLPCHQKEHGARFFKILSEVLQAQPAIRVDQADQLEDALLRDQLQVLGYQSLVLFPINAGNGHLGTLVCSQEMAAKAWRDRDIELLQAVCDRLAIAIQQAVLYQQSRQSEQEAIAKTQELETTLKQLKQTQTQLIQAEKMSGLGQLVAGVAHEINNPVSFIFGNLVHAKEYSQDLLKLIALYQQHGIATHPEITEFIDEIDFNYLQEDMPNLFSSIETGAVRIQKIVRSLRTFSRLDEADVKTIDINESLESTLMILSSRLQGSEDCSEIELVSHYGTVPQVSCYAGALNQVFMNLINNAVDAIREANPTQGRLTLETAIREEGRLQIKISDNGSGIPESVQDRIFDPFYTTKPVGKGTGLGLSISYQIIVERHQGTLTCDSTPGEGSTFIIELPLQPSSES
ncbi:PAS domain S-box protein [Phormidium yuhuli AB48]|uniref:histidine kinase n=1 Tax=Phormidium yuhuli AB48 TaxID=2940671 RepID=A0ABY5AV33_9CYAN|nr:PAS domain S-box protein [Phormidium yuhuli]USR93094.1 PAS domain S-box protein [Phormidium yuhuli AB48]